tara:strand:- start:1352 stop:2635 length:1284 start_codon:yes stop_codon:yes gene_type:complete
MINPYEFIKTKKAGKNHESGEIRNFINSYLKNEIEDSQLSAWLMAVCFNGMSDFELKEYVNVIINSGNQLNFSHLNGFIVDKHSTGGVGDKVSLIVGPILAACNCYVPMIVGRSLAHTGGTLDKLESIKGYKGEISTNQFKKNVEKNRISIIGQNNEICPADKHIYSVRDVTATIESFPLICASIISKKKAEGINALILDIKVGNGAFMKTLKEAQQLGKALTKLGNSLSIDSKYIISDMNEPLGISSGLWCEVQESIMFLKNNKRDPKLNEITFKICSIALAMAGEKNPNKLIEEAISSGKAYEIFEKMVKSHNGNLKDSYNENNYKYEYVVKANKSGYINKIDTEKLGYILLEIGGGRKTSKDKIDSSCGSYIYKKLNQYVEKNEPIIKIFGSNINKIQQVEKMAENVIFIDDFKKNKETILIYE